MKMPGHNTLAINWSCEAVVHTIHYRTPSQGPQPHAPMDYTP